MLELCWNSGASCISRAVAYQETPLCYVAGQLRLHPALQFQASCSPELQHGYQRWSTGVQGLLAVLQGRVQDIKKWRGEGQIDRWGGVEEMAVPYQGLGLDETKARMVWVGVSTFLMIHDS